LNNYFLLLQYLFSDSVKKYSNLKWQIKTTGNFKLCLKNDPNTYLLIEKSFETNKFSIEMPIEGNGGVALRIIFAKEGNVYKIINWANPD